MLFQQLFEPESSTYTYLLGDPETREAVIIDPVLETVERDLAAIKEHNLNLAWILETHLHADHITGAGRLSDLTGATIALSASARVQSSHHPLSDGEILRIGQYDLRVIATPGHTKSCLCYSVGNILFTGDTLLIDGNGRTDFQGGSAQELFSSIKEKLYTLPDETVVYPGHDYKGLRSTTIGEQKLKNARIPLDQSLEGFVRLMANLKLPAPRKIDVALPANLKCGRL